MEKLVDDPLPPGMLVDALFNDAESIIILTRNDFKVIRTSLAARILFGEKTGSLPGSDFCDLLHGESLAMLTKIRTHLNINGEAFSIPLSALDYAGNARPFIATIRFLSCEQCPYGNLLIYLKNTEKKSRSSLRPIDVDYSIRRLLMGLSDSVLLISFMERAISDCNPAAESLFGYTRDELIGRSPQFLSASESDAVEHAKKSFSSYARSGFYQEMILCKKKNGTLFLTLATNIALYDYEKRLCYILAINRDITEHSNRIQTISNLSGQSRQLLQQIELLLAPFKTMNVSLSMSDMGFTGKQISIVSHIITGEPTKSIAGKLRVSESAIKNHLTVIYRRLGVSSRVEFMRYLHDHHVNIE